MAHPADKDGQPARSNPALQTLTLALLGTLVILLISPVSRPYLLCGLTGAESRVWFSTPLRPQNLTVLPQPDSLEDAALIMEVMAARMQTEDQKPSREELVTALEIAQAAAEQDKDNGYWWAAQAVIYEFQSDSNALAMAISKSNASRTFFPYGFTLRSNLIQSLQNSTGVSRTSYVLANFLNGQEPLSKQYLQLTESEPIFSTAHASRRLIYAGFSSPFEKYSFNHVLFRQSIPEMLPSAGLATVAIGLVCFALIRLARLADLRFTRIAWGVALGLQISFLFANGTSYFMHTALGTVAMVIVLQQFIWPDKQRPKIDSDSGLFWYSGWGLAITVFLMCFLWQMASSTMMQSMFQSPMSPVAGFVLIAFAPLVFSEKFERFQNEPSKLVTNLVTVGSSVSIISVIYLLATVQQRADMFQAFLYAGYP